MEGSIRYLVGRFDYAQVVAVKCAVDIYKTKLKEMDREEMQSRGRVGDEYICNRVLELSRGGNCEGDIE